MFLMLVCSCMNNNNTITQHSEISDFSSQRNINHRLKIGIVMTQDKNAVMLKSLLFYLSKNTHSHIAFQVKSNIRDLDPDIQHIVLDGKYIGSSDKRNFYSITHQDYNLNGLNILNFRISPDDHVKSVLKSIREMGISKISIIGFNSHKIQYLFEQYAKDYQISIISKYSVLGNKFNDIRYFVANSSRKMLINESGLYESIDIKRYKKMLKHNQSDDLQIVEPEAFLVLGDHALLESVIRSNLAFGNKEIFFFDGMQPNFKQNLSKIKHKGSFFYTTFDINSMDNFYNEYYNLYKNYPTVKMMMISDIVGFIIAKHDPSNGLRDGLFQGSIGKISIHPREVKRVFETYRCDQDECNLLFLN